MEFRNVLCILAVSLLLMGAVCAQKNVNDFQVDKSYNNVYNGNYYSMYLGQNQASGVTIYNGAVGDVDDNDAYDDLIHDNGREYLTPDDDMKIVKNPDNTVNFTDYDHAQHGVAEVIKVDGGEFVVVFWAKDSSNVNNAQLTTQLNKFNSDNNVKAVAA